MRKLLMTASLVGILALTAGPGNAQTSQFISSPNAFEPGNIRNATRLTFSSPFSLPGVTLPAGTYVFHFPGRSYAMGGSFDVVQVVSENYDAVYAMVPTIPVERPLDENVRSLENEVVFRETPAGQPQPIAAWFPKDEWMGVAFSYGD
jgi:hypothetical protein